jgi:hypothetical protein
VVGSIRLDDLRKGRAAWQNLNTKSIPLPPGGSAFHADSCRSSAAVSLSVAMRAAAAVSGQTGPTEEYPLVVIHGEVVDLPHPSTATTYHPPCQ